MTTNERSDDDLLTTRQVAELVGVSAQTVRRWRFDGDLAYVVLGRRTVRHRRSDVAELVERQVRRNVVVD